MNKIKKYRDKMIEVSAHEQNNRSKKMNIKALYNKQYKLYRLTTLIKLVDLHMFFVTIRLVRIKIKE